MIRIALIEETLIKNGTMISVRKEEEEVNSFEMFHNFVKKHDLPLKSLFEVQQFEDHLKVDQFRQEAVSYRWKKKNFTSKYNSRSILLIHIPDKFTIEFSRNGFGRSTEICEERRALDFR